LRGVFDSWRAEGAACDYQAWDFFPAFLDFVGSRYRDPRSAGVTILWRFYAALAGQSRGAVGGRRLGDGLIRMREGVRVVTAEGDVVGALACLREGRRPDASFLCGLRTFALQESNGRRNVIRELPALTAAILERCESPVTEAELAARLTEDGFTLGHALEVLDQQGLIRLGSKAGSEACLTR
jgi:hypothetical protein